MDHLSMTPGEACWLAWLNLHCPVSVRYNTSPASRATVKELRVAWHTTPLGCLFVAGTSRGISQLLFRRPGVSDALLRRQLLRQWPGLSMVTDPDGTARMLAPLLGAGLSAGVELDVIATPFQARVWQALLEVGPGATVSYGELATRIGRPTAFRAVGRAVGANPVALLIPCHRVVPATGGVGNYRWGVSRKRRLLSVESRLSALAS
jgi:AraC family transcriptional regulator, regulatory protein of adaptative response / methylated-DNA-[protein]-cysteine methyltransferase